MYNENKPSKIFFNDLPDEIKNGFLHQIYYNVNRKALYLLRYGKMVKIPNITSLYYYDDDFYVNSDGCLIIIWVDIKTWNIKKKKKKGVKKMINCKFNLTLYQLKLLIDIIHTYDGEFVLNDEENEIFEIFKRCENEN